MLQHNPYMHVIKPSDACCCAYLTKIDVLTTFCYLSTTYLLKYHQSVRTVYPLVS